MNTASSDFLEITGKSVEEALSSALSEMGADRDDVDVEIINEGNRGILGIIGKQDAKIRVRRKLTPVDMVCKFINDIFFNMGAKITAKAEEKPDFLKIVLEGEDVGSAIGRRGEVLDALQYLSSLVYNKNSTKYSRVIIDSENYRNKREETLRRLAEKLADKVQRYRKEIILEPMNPYERRIIHSMLQNHKAVRTYSIGSEPNRKVVITCK